MTNPSDGPFVVATDRGLARLGITTGGDLTLDLVDSRAPGTRYPRGVPLLDPASGLVRLLGVDGVAVVVPDTTAPQVIDSLLSNPPDANNLVRPIVTARQYDDHLRSVTIEVTYPHGFAGDFLILHQADDPSSPYGDTLGYKDLAGGSAFPFRRVGYGLPIGVAPAQTSFVVRAVAGDRFGPQSGWRLGPVATFTATEQDRFPPPPPTPDSDFYINRDFDSSDIAYVASENFPGGWRLDFAWRSLQVDPFGWLVVRRTTPSASTPPVSVQRTIPGAARTAVLLLPEAVAGLVVILDLYRQAQDGDGWQFAQTLTHKLGSYP